MIRTVEVFGRANRSSPADTRDAPGLVAGEQVATVTWRHWAVSGAFGSAGVGKGAATARSAIASRRRLQRPSPQVEDRKPELLVQTDSFGDLTGH